MTQAELFALMERFDKSGIAELSYRQGAERILLRKAAAMSQPVAAVAVGAPIAIAAPAAVAAPATTNTGRAITAPLVGTFYACPSPDAPPFAAVGKAVKKGETVAILEAMKMINEVPAPCDCVIEEILVENGALVGFAEPIMRIRET